jgi:spermidine synthase
MRTTAVELNPAVIAACRRSFHLPADGPKLQVLAQDAGRWVDDAAHLSSVQLLHVDLYDQDAAAPVLDDARFYAACRGVLAEGGVMSVNLFGRDVSFGRSAERISAVFGAARVAMLKATKEGNTIVLAWKGFELPAREELAARAAQIEAQHDLPARKWLKLLQNLPDRSATAA